MSIATTDTERGPAPERPHPAVGGALSLRDICIDFGGKRAVDGVDLEIAPGEITILLGPSGCGKSTILRALAGLLPTNSGTMTMDGETICGPSPERAMVFQEDALFPWRTARANVELALRLRKRPRRECRRRSKELLAHVGLDGFGDHLPHQLSGGMRQRVQLARTLGTQPRVLLMDEPFGALDAQSRRAMQQLLIDVWDQYRTTVVFVTHDPDEALLLGDRIVVMTAGPAKVHSVMPVETPRAPGSQFTPAFTRTRYEILAALGDHDGVEPTASTDPHRP